ncbi:deoxyribonuclease V [Alloalcanivorax gelatiniphagus]|uniref:Endonuclease V n=1 Tax=Alloalcanivorax gelatiniphagus TaxID=1194167 RepID=A0ABY2XIP9_9GAMM|nr:deoxyribonuclease V [Alloalcanivorax gelatiniphagus]TMW11333.1 deoxyribonuclease V [Alloalcanivorax gelatiniphagus]
MSAEPISAEQLQRDWAAITPARAKALQLETARQVRLQPDLPTPATVAGVDVGFENRDTARAAIVVLRHRDLEPVDYALARLPVRFPYVPGLLSFRECPVILKALEQLQTLPDVLLCDGHGVAHPRRLGIAAHLGVLTGLPTVGVAKKKLYGWHGPVPEGRGEWTPLMAGRASAGKASAGKENQAGETLGAVLRTRPGFKPLFVSPGHRLDLQGALDLVMHCTTRYRLPETTRWADGLASNRGQRWLARLEALPGAGG